MTDPKQVEAKAFRGRLADWLAALATTEEADAVRVHLGDLRDAATHLAALIGELPELNVTTQRPEIAKQLSYIKGELYDHMTPHMKQLKAGLAKLTSRVYGELDEDDVGP